jgi:hypothetical protein
MNFSEFCESMQDPLFEKKGEEPTCEAGYTWNKKLGKCVPDRHKNHAGENPGDRNLPNPLGGYDVWGSTGIDGDGYAMEVNEESIEETMLYHPTAKDEKRRAEAERKHKEQDDRMRYGKDGKPEKQLRRGEVRKFNKETGKWESNK